MTATPSGGTSPFLPVFRNWDVDDKQLRINLQEYMNNVAYSVNIKTNGQFETIELLTGEQFTTPGNALVKRQVFRKIFYFTGSGPITHGVTGVTLYTHIYGTATDGTNWYPLPNDDIDITVTPTQIQITSSGPTLTSGVMILEYVKN